MSNINEENKVSGVFGGVKLDNIGNVGNIGNIGNEETIQQEAGTIRLNNNGGNQALTKRGFWSKFKAFWLQEIDWNKEIKVELTPYQQKVEDEINEFLHQEITWEKVHDFLFQEVSFGKKKNNK